jgi:hypothetical protein
VYYPSQIREKRKNREKYSTQPQKNGFPINIIHNIKKE